MILFTAVGTCVGFFMGLLLPRSKQIVRHAHKAWLEHQRHYFQSLKYFIDQQHDKAAEVLIEFLEVNEDSIDIYLALGELFRKKGEVGRAIRIHQHLLANPKLFKKKKQDLEFQLAQDYFSAGVLDRAESLFLSILQVRSKDMESLNFLLKIYEQNKDWLACIKVAKQLLPNSPEVRVNLAHYFCQRSSLASSTLESLKLLKKALSYHPSCPRALLGQAQHYYDQAKYDRSIKVLQSIPIKNQAYNPLVLSLLYKCHEASDQWQNYVSHLKSLLDCSAGQFLIIKALCQCFVMRNDIARALEFLEDALSKSPSIQGVQYFLELKTQSDPCRWPFMPFITQALNALNHEKTSYACHSCGYQAQALFWQCPSCKRWESVNLCSH